MTKRKGLNVHESIPAIFDRLFHHVTGEHDQPRSYINRVTAEACASTRPNDHVGPYIDAFMEMLNIADGDRAKALEALRFRSTPVGLRYDYVNWLLLIVYNPKAERAGIIIPGYHRPCDGAPLPVKMVDSGGHMVPDFMYDKRCSGHQGFLTFVYNTETKEWTRPRFTSDFTQNSEVGNVLQQWLKSDITKAVDWHASKELNHAKHVFGLMDSLEDETSLIFTELATSCVLTMLTGTLQRADSVINTLDFSSRRLDDWQNIVTGLKRLFPAEVVDALLDKRQMVFGVDVESIGRVRFIAKAGLDQLKGDSTQTLTIEDLERDGSFVIVREKSIDVNNEAINRVLAGATVTVQRLTQITNRYDIQELTIPVIPSEKSAPVPADPDLKTIAINNRLTRKVILTKLMEVMGADITFLNGEEIRYLNSCAPEELLATRYGKALKVLKDNFWPRMGYTFLTHSAFRELGEDRVPGIMSIAIHGVSKGAARVTMWEAENEDDVRVVDTDMATVLHSCAAATPMGSLLVKLNDEIGLIDTEARREVDTIEHPNFHHDIFLRLQQVHTRTVQDRVSDAGKDPISEALRPTTRDRFAEEKARLETIPDWKKQETEHDYHVAIGRAVIGCLRDFGRESIGEAQLVWVQEALARMLVTKEEIGIAEDETLIKSEGRWFWAKEV